MKPVGLLSGQLLDEVTMKCVDPSECRVCMHDGERIPHGNKVILKHDDPEHCRIWYVTNTVEKEISLLFPN